MPEIISKLFSKSLGLIKSPKKILRLLFNPAKIFQDIKDIKNEKVLNQGERTIIYDWQKSKNRKESLENWGHLGIIFRYEWVSQFVKGKKILDIGCAVGYGPYYFAKNGAVKVVGFDNSKEAIGWAKEHYSLPNLEFLIGDCLSLPFSDDSFDTVISFDLLEHITEEQQKQFISEVKRVLKTEGTAIIGTPNAEADETSLLGIKNVFHLRELNKSEFENLMEEYFDQIQLKGEDMIVGGKRLKDGWLEYLKDNKVSIDNIKMVDTEIEKTRGLIAICKKPKK